MFIELNSFEKEILDDASHVKFDSLQETDSYLKSKGFAITPQDFANQLAKNNTKVISYTIDLPAASLGVNVYPNGFAADLAKEPGQQAVAVPSNKACLTIKSNVKGTPLETTRIYPFKSQQFHGHEAAHVIQQKQGRVQPSPNL
jgi:hypothetical protein